MRISLRWLPGLLLAMPALPAAAYGPRANYQLHCMGCHGAEGAGEPGRVPSLRATLVPLAGSRAGRDFLLRVPGVATAPLGDGELAALMNWMARDLSAVAVPAAFKDFTAAEVSGPRRHPLADVSAARARLLRAPR